MSSFTHIWSLGESDAQQNLRVGNETLASANGRRQERSWFSKGDNITLNIENYERTYWRKGKVLSRIFFFFSQKASNNFINH